MDKDGKEISKSKEVSTFFKFIYILLKEGGIIRRMISNKRRNRKIAAKRNFTNVFF
jgi:hypothetical protein